VCQKEFVDTFVDVPGLEGKRHVRDPYISVDIQMYSGRSPDMYGGMYPLTGHRPFYMCLPCGSRFIKNIANHEYK
jgi:hypothetical protein